MGDSFTYNFRFVPIAAAVIYSIGFGLPFALKLLMKLLGSNFFASSYIEVIASLVMSIGGGNIWLFVFKFFDNILFLCNSD